MAAHIPESDWKKFRKLREATLERFCDRTLAELAKLATSDTPGPHKRYLEVYDLIQRRDRELALAFDDLSRSRAKQQLGAMHALGLLEDGEFAAFTEETREAVMFFSKMKGR